MTVNTNTLFKNYFARHSYDEMFDANMQVKGDWAKLLDRFQQIGPEGLAQRQKDLDWILAENGVTYNVYNDPNGLNRPWNLNILPFLIHQNEWSGIEKGIQQRAMLLDLVLKDIYGKRELIKNGVVPMEVIYGHRGFLRQCDQISYNTNQHLLVHATDLSRGPDGRMWVVNDRTQAPSGMGYALENRLSTGRIFPEMVSDLQVRHLSGFFQDFHQLLLDASPKKIDNPNIVILTPGSHNETYFEHAYLSSFLGYPLVQGNDLVVRNGFLWMKSLQGLKRIDVVLRRVDDAFMDSLELREDSQLGVAGLLDVVRQKNVSLINPIGAGILENPGLIPFMGAACKYFLNEDLILPQIASWWCGQEKERNYVLENLPKLVVKRIDRTNRESIFFGEFLSKEQLAELAVKIKERPYRFVAQEKISFSTAPNFNNGQFEPRNMVFRTFSVAKDQAYATMPGGLVRVAAKGNLRVSNQRGGTSKDFWVIGDGGDNDPSITSWAKKSSISASGLENLPSLTAENLYWAGRYIGRTLVTARFMRMVVKQMASVKFESQKTESDKLRVLLRAVTHLTHTFPGFLEEDEEGKHAMDDPYAEMVSVLLDATRVGSLANTLQSLENAFFSIRNLWSSDMWRVFGDMKKTWSALEHDPNPTLNKIIRSLDQLITRIIAFMGLIEESILVQQGLLLYFIGLQLEQAILTVSKSRALLVFAHEPQVEYEVLEALLNSHESLNIYRYSYRSYITLENVIDLILLDFNYPRSVAFQLNRLNKDIDRLPKSAHSHGLTGYQHQVFEALSKIKLAAAKELIKQDMEMTYIRGSLDDLLAELTELLYGASQTLSDTYFNHTNGPSQIMTQKFPL